MTITVELIGEGVRQVDVDGGRYGELLEPFEVSSHEVAILVDGTPVPEDRPIDDDVERVRVLRLVKGG